HGRKITDIGGGDRDQVGALVADDAKLLQPLLRLGADLQSRRAPSSDGVLLRDRVLLLPDVFEDRLGRHGVFRLARVCHGGSPAFHWSSRVARYPSIWTDLALLSRDRGRDTMQRKLTAILSADVVGYSGLMQADEAGTLDRLKANRMAIFDPQVAAHGGRV